VKGPDRPGWYATDNSKRQAIASVVANNQNIFFCRECGISSTGIGRDQQRARKSLAQKNKGRQSRPLYR
jgi:hypothetical protein